MTDKMFRYLNHTSVEGLDLIFKVLCLICNNEVLCVLNDLHKDNLELKDTMKRMVIEMMGG